MNVFERAKEYQAVLNEMRMSADDRTTLQDELNAEWKYLNQEVIITGQATIRCDTTKLVVSDQFIPADDEYTERILVEHRAVSRGFQIIERSIELDGERIGGRLEIVHALAIEGAKDTWVDAHHGLGECEILPLEENVDDTVARARYYLEDETTDIDIAVINSETDQQRIDALKELRFYGSGLGADGMESDEYYEVLTAYLNSLISFDTRVPYTMTLEGACGVENNARTTQLWTDLKREKHLAYPEKLLVRETELHAGHVCMRAEVLRDNKPSVFIEMPLDTILHIKSVREKERRRANTQD
jgi:hypothetical protein